MPKTDISKLEEWKWHHIFDSSFCFDAGFGGSSILSHWWRPDWPYCSFGIRFNFNLSVFCSLQLQIPSAANLLYAVSIWKSAPFSFITRWYAKRLPQRMSLFLSNFGTIPSHFLLYVGMHQSSFPLIDSGSFFATHASHHCIVEYQSTKPLQYKDKDKAIPQCRDYQQRIEYSDHRRYNMSYNWII